ncbi:MAG: sulfurtransferase TusA family protein [Candidatus Dormibacteria bacterium]
MSAIGRDTVGAGARPAPTAVLDLALAEQECGDPALERVRRAYATLAPGEVLEARSPVAEHGFAVRAWARRAGAELIADGRAGAVAVLQVRRPL